MPTRYFTTKATPDDIQGVRQYLATLPMSEKLGFRTAGIHKGVFITEDGSYSRLERSPGIVYMNEIDTGCRLIKSKPIIKSQKIDWSPLFGFNYAEVVWPVLGWSIACFFKPTILKLLNGFPILNMEGEAESGKTSTADSVVKPLWALEGKSPSIGAQTEFSIMKRVSGSNCIPIIYEENKDDKQNQNLKTIVSNLIRQSYNALLGDRGRADQSLQTYRYEAPICIIGESGFSEAAVRDRLVVAAFSKRDSSPHEAQFKLLDGLPLKNLGRSILENALSMPENQVEKLLTEELSKVSQDLRNRPRNNAAVCRTGIRILAKVLNLQLAGYGQHIDAAVKQGISDGGKVRLSNCDKILEAWCRMSACEGNNGSASHEYLREGFHYQLDNGHIRLWVSGIFDEFKRWAQIHGYEGTMLPE